MLLIMVWVRLAALATSRRSWLLVLGAALVGIALMMLIGTNGHRPSPLKASARPKE
jgi:Tfp pilus assembly protein PilN